MENSTSGQIFMSVHRIRCENVYPNIVETEIAARGARQRNLLSLSPSTVSSSG